MLIIFELFYPVLITLHMFLAWKFLWAENFKAVLITFNGLCSQFDIKNIFKTSSYGQNLLLEMTKFLPLIFRKNFKKWGKNLCFYTSSSPLNFKDTQYCCFLAPFSTNDSVLEKNRIWEFFHYTTFGSAGRIDASAP